MRNMQNRLQRLEQARKLPARRIIVLGLDGGDPALAQPQDGRGEEEEDLVIIRVQYADV